MREIKFRAWNPYTKSMYFYDVDTLSCMPSQCKPFLMQFTGLKDKNGKEIYEGDVVRANSWANSIIVFGKIGYDGEWNGLTGYALEIWGADNNFYELQYHFDPNKLEVIGNIYENPELKP